MSLIFYVMFFLFFFGSFHVHIFSVGAIVLDSVRAPSVLPQVLACMRLVEFWPGRESPESISGPFNRTPCRKGFNLLIREAAEVRSGCRCHGQGKLCETKCWQLVIQEAKAKTAHSSMTLTILKSLCGSIFFFFFFSNSDRLFWFLMPADGSAPLWTNRLLSVALFCFAWTTTTLHF